MHTSLFTVQVLRRGCFRGGYAAITTTTRLASTIVGTSTTMPGHGCLVVVQGRAYSTSTTSLTVQWDRPTTSWSGVVGAVTARSRYCSITETQTGGRYTARCWLKSRLDLDWLQKGLSSEILFNHRGGGFQGNFCSDSVDWYGGFGDVMRSTVFG